jgi:5-methylcytosine-specific restriction enzyme subunit McrC
VPELRLAEWETRGPDREPLARRTIEDAPARRLVEELNRSGVLQVQELRRGLQVTATSYVGRIQVDDLVITVEPKLQPKTLLGLVRYAYGLRHLRLYGVAEYRSAGSLFQDLLAAQLLSEARELLDGGLARRYLRREHELSAPRGRIDFGKLAARPDWTRATVPCVEYPRSTDHLLNRSLRAGVDLAAHVAQDRVLSRDLKGTAAVLTEVAGPLELTRETLVQAEREITRLTFAYSSAVRLIQLLHSSTWLSLDDHRGVRLPGFLFDMNRFFQALVARFLSEHLRCFDVSEEEPLGAFMRYLPDHNPHGRRSPSPRPDFTVRKGGRIVTFLDAKYRDLLESDLPREMLYQLAVYALSQGDGGKAAIVFPSTASSEAVIEIAGLGNRRWPAQVALRPFDLAAIARIIEDEDQAEGAQVAQTLVCGAGGVS